MCPSNPHTARWGHIDTTDIRIGDKYASNHLVTKRHEGVLYVVCELCQCLIVECNASLLLVSLYPVTGAMVWSNKTGIYWFVLIPGVSPQFWYQCLKATPVLATNYLRLLIHTVRVHSHYGKL